MADKPRYASPRYDIRDIVAEADKFANRFLLGATGPSGQSISAEANYFYHLKDDKVSEFWLLAGRQLARLLLISSIAFDPKRTRVLS